MEHRALHTHNKETQTGPTLSASLKRDHSITPHSETVPQHSLQNALQSRGKKKKKVVGFRFLMKWSIEMNWFNESSCNFFVWFSILTLKLAAGILKRGSSLAFLSSSSTTFEPPTQR